MSLFQELQNEIELAIQNHQLSWAPIPVSIVRTILERLALTGFEYFPWDATALPKSARFYGDNWSQILSEELLTFDSQIILVIPGEVDASHWLFYKGLSSELELLLSEAQFVEYCICNLDLSLFLFDTHHDSFVMVFYRP